MKNTGDGPTYKPSASAVTRSVFQHTSKISGFKVAMKITLSLITWSTTRGSRELRRCVDLEAGFHTIFFEDFDDAFFLIRVNDETNWKVRAPPPITQHGRAQWRAMRIYSEQHWMRSVVEHDTLASALISFARDISTACTHWTNNIKLMLLKKTYKNNILSNWC